MLEQRIGWLGPRSADGGRCLLRLLNEVFTRFIRDLVSEGDIEFRSQRDISEKFESDFRDVQMYSLGPMSNRH